MARFCIKVACGCFVWYTSYRRGEECSMRRMHAGLHVPGAVSGRGAYWRPGRHLGGWRDAVPATEWQVRFATISLSPSLFLLNSFG